MRGMIFGLLLLCGTLFCADWKEMSDAEKGGCFCARDLNQRIVALFDHKEFKSESGTRCAGCYKDFCKDGIYPDMILGTACTPNEEFVDVCLPSYRQTHRLMRETQEYIVKVLEDTIGQNVWKKAVGIYLMPGAAAWLESATPYVKIPCADPGLLAQSMQNSLLEMPEYCVIFSDVFDTGRKEFEALERVLGMLLPRMTDEQRDGFQVLFVATYLENGCDKDMSACFGGHAYPIGVVQLRGKVLDRITMHAKLRVMEDYLAQPEKASLRAWVYKHDKESLGDALRAILLQKPNITNSLDDMAYKWYMRYVIPQAIFRMSAHDFVERRWIGKVSADHLRFVPPYASVGACASLNLQPIIEYLLRVKGVRHCLEPIFYFPEDQMILLAPENHAQISQELTGQPTQHEANIVTLYAQSNGHHKVQQDWLDRCKGYPEWHRGETIGVILLDPYESFADQRCPTEENYPNLLADVMDDMQKDLQGQGYKVLFLHLFHNGLCRDNLGAACPYAVKKYPISYKLLDHTVRVVWQDNVRNSPVRCTS